VEVKEKYQVKISNRCEALENLDDDDDNNDYNVDINRACKNIRQNIKASASESKLL